MTVTLRSERLPNTDGMCYDLKLIDDLCREIGLRSVIRSNELVEVELDKGVVLCFQNAEKDEDCLVGFEGTPWHTHGNFIFSGGHGNFIELNYLDVLSGLQDGEVLICELWRAGKVVDRWLVHAGYNDELKYMEEGEEIRIRRGSVT